MGKRFITAFILFSGFFTRAQLISTVIGNGSLGYSGDGGPSTAAKIRNFSPITSDTKGNIYFGDNINNVVRKVDTLGVITTIAGNGVGAGLYSGSFSGDGGPATSAGFYFPGRVAFDSLGNLYIPDFRNHRVRKVDLSGIVTTVVGTGVASSTGDGGPAINSSLSYPLYVTFDSNWNMFIVEYGGGKIRKVNKLGIINTIAGNGILGYSGDGGNAILASLNYPTSMYIDALGNILISDSWNACIRKVNTSGVITTIAGTGTGGYGGDGGSAISAQINLPYALTQDGMGNIYIADSGNNRVRQINTSGIIKTIAGNGLAGYTGDGCLPDTTRLSTPTGVAFDSKGNLFISDQNNARIRKINYGVMNSINNYAIKKNQFNIYPNPSSNSIAISSNNALGEVIVYNLLGNVVYSIKSENSIEKINLLDLPSGIYFIEVNFTRTKFIKE